MGDVPDVGHRCGGREVDGFPVFTTGVDLLMVDANTLRAAFNVVSTLPLPSADGLEVRSTIDELRGSMPCNVCLGIKRKINFTLNVLLEVFDFLDSTRLIQTCHAPGSKRQFNFEIHYTM